MHYVLKKGKGFFLIEQLLKNNVKIYEIYR
jgi:hypothetical protein